jgi:hypothetical protein
MPFPAPTSSIFLSYFYGWNRLEGRSRHDDFSEGLTVPVADPLWLLGRQWQCRELDGEDAATPIHVELTYETAPLDRIKLGDDAAAPLDTTPVEVLVEREQVGWDWRQRVRIGQQFERIARDFYASAPSTAVALIDSLRTGPCRIDSPGAGSPAWVATDVAARRFLAVVAGRAIDGQQLIEKLTAGQLSAIDSNLANRMTDWYDALYSQGPAPVSAAWRSERLDYEFRLQSTDLSVPGPVHAPSYRNGGVDWEAFSVEKRATDALGSPKALQLTPTHAVFAGQPMRRWWEFENAAVNLGTIDVAKTDLGKLALMEFALIFGDDWFVVPLPAVPNTLLRVTNLAVHDCFGQVTTIPSARSLSADPTKPWQVFTLAPEGVGSAVGDFLLVPSIVGTRDESPVLEEVRFARDEDANVVFAIETTVLNQVGEPESGFAAHLEAVRRVREQEEAAAASATATVSGTSSATSDEEASASPAADAGSGGADGASAEPPATIQFVLGTKVPDNWIPFIATDANVVNGLPARRVLLRRAMVLAPDAPDDTPIDGKTRLLKEGSGARVDWVREDAVGREGVRVELRRQRTRDAAGNTYVWLGRKIRVGRGEARSGLRFDVVKARTE